MPVAFSSRWKHACVVESQYEVQLQYQIEVSAGGPWLDGAGGMPVVVQQDRSRDRCFGEGGGAVDGVASRTGSETPSSADIGSRSAALLMRRNMFSR
jgi:hypothetical protein